MAKNEDISKPDNNFVKLGMEIMSEEATAQVPYDSSLTPTTYSSV